MGNQNTASLLPNFQLNKSVRSLYTFLFDKWLWTLIAVRFHFVDMSDSQQEVLNIIQKQNKCWLITYIDMLSSGGLTNSYIAWK